MKYISIIVSGCLLLLVGCITSHPISNKSDAISFPVNTNMVFASESIGKELLKANTFMADPEWIQRNNNLLYLSDLQWNGIKKQMLWKATGNESAPQYKALSRTIAEFDVACQKEIAAMKKIESRYRN